MDTSVYVFYVFIIFMYEIMMIFLFLIAFPTLVR